MFTLPHQLEFMSDAWLEEARHYLERHIVQRKEHLGPRPFSVSERFTNTPPHLGLPNHTASWHVRYDGERIQVGRDFIADADVTVESDYQAALMSAQFVGLRAPGGMETMFREIAHVFGRDAIRVKGQLQNEAA